MREMGKSTLLLLILGTGTASAQVTGHVTQLANPSGFSSSATHLNFDNLLAGTTVTSQFQTFGITFGGPISFDFTPTQPVTGTTFGVVVSQAQLLNGATTKSPPNALIGYCNCSNTSAKAPFPMSFALPVRRVGMFVGNGTGSSFIHYTLTAFDSHGIAIGAVGLDVTADVSTFIGLDAGSDVIASVQIESQTPLPAAVFGVPLFDDLYFEASPPPPPAPGRPTALLQTVQNTWSNVARFCESQPSCVSSVTDSPALLASYQPPMVQGLANGPVRLAIANGSLQDTDLDGIPDVVDNCPFVANPAQNCCDPLTIGHANCFPLSTAVSAGGLCPGGLPYNGGQIVTKPKIYNVFLGRNGWDDGHGGLNAAGQAINLAWRRLAQNPDFYYVGSQYTTFSSQRGLGTFRGWAWYPNLFNGVSQVGKSDIVNWLRDEVQYGGLGLGPDGQPDPNIIYVVYPPNGLQIELSSCPICAPGCANGGVHDHDHINGTQVVVAIIGYCQAVADAGAGTISTSAAAHEIYEAMTDPQGHDTFSSAEAWRDTMDGDECLEVADRCERENGGKLAGYNVPSEWSNLAVAMNVWPCITNPNPMLVGDFNGDGRSDVFFFRPADQSWWVGTSQVNLNPGRCSAWCPSQARSCNCNRIFEFQEFASQATTPQLPTLAPSDPIMSGHFIGTVGEDLLAYVADSQQWVVVTRPITVAVPPGSPRVPGCGGNGAACVKTFAVTDGSFGPAIGGSDDPVKVESDQIVVGDFDGNGRSDVAFFHPVLTSFDEVIDDHINLQRNGGTWWIGLSDGTRFNFSSTREATAPVTHSSQKMLLGKFLGTRLTDILVYDFFWDSWAVYEWNGSFLAKDLISSHFPTGVFGANFQQGDPIFANDFDGDGLTDILYYKSSTHTWWVGINTPNGVDFAFNFVPFAQTPQLGDSATSFVLTGRFHDNLWAADALRRCRCGQPERLARRAQFGDRGFLLSFGSLADHG